MNAGGQGLPEFAASCAARLGKQTQESKPTLSAGHPASGIGPLQVRLSASAPPQAPRNWRVCPCTAWNCLPGSVRAAVRGGLYPEHSVLLSPPTELLQAGHGASQSRFNTLRFTRCTWLFAAVINN